METALLVGSAARFCVFELKQGQLLIPLCRDKCIFLAKMS